MDGAWAGGQGRWAEQGLWGGAGRLEKDSRRGKEVYEQGAGGHSLCGMSLFWLLIFKCWGCC